MTILKFMAGMIGVIAMMALPETLSNLIHWLGLDWLIAIAFLGAIPVALYKIGNYWIDRYYGEKE